MKETNGLDIFEQIPSADAICIPTNCSLEQDGCNPMGALAGQAALRWPILPELYGKLLMLIPNIPVLLGWANKTDTTKFVDVLTQLSNPAVLVPHITPDYNDSPYESNGEWCAVVALPTMHAIGEPASLDLVLRSAELLVEMSTLTYAWKSIYLGSPGTGAGGLEVTSTHRALREIFDDRFTVMQK